MSLLFFLFAGQVQLQPNEPEPQFLASLENMTASQGRDVQFTCIVDHLGPYRVSTSGAGRLEGERHGLAAGVRLAQRLRGRMS